MLVTCGTNVVNSQHQQQQKDFSDKYVAKQTMKMNFHQHTENSASWASFQKGTLSSELLYILGHNEHKTILKTLYPKSKKLLETSME